ncbi:MAG: GGDEF domain-containing protein [Symploca sp. SIO2E9]|nr:GGDEF domain-containing protein [Symploca sp. SIO2E9]
MKDKLPGAKHKVGKILFIYAFFSSLWILFSDQLLTLLTNDLQRLTQLQTLKGWVFVIITSGLLYVLVRQELRSPVGGDNSSFALALGKTNGNHLKNLKTRIISHKSHYGFGLKQQQLEAHSFDELLKGLPNRALFLELLEQLIVRSRNGQVGLFAVLFLEIERFEIVKYSLGQQAAEQLMVATAHRLEACLCSTDTLVRLASAEFAILLPNIQYFEHATDMAKYIQQQLRLPFDLNGYEVFATNSIGIAVCGKKHRYFKTQESSKVIAQEAEFNFPYLHTPNSQDLLNPNHSSATAELMRSPLTYCRRAEELLQAADTAKHYAKVHPDVRYAVFNPAMHQQVAARFHLETDLRRAMECQQLMVYYQPIVSLKTGIITGFEALARWNHPTRGAISPTEFIPLAQETGLIQRLDWWMIGEACTQLGVWQRTFATEEPLKMSVNLSGWQFGQIGLLEHLDQILQQTGINRGSLKLEITETSLLKDSTSGVATLEQMKALGIELSIDDFGTGYSSLDRLHQLPIDTLKIDRSFVKRLGTDCESLEIVRTIIALAHNLKMEIIAEGVETTQQLSLLRSLNCEYVQGYFFSKPVDSDSARELIAKGLEYHCLNC